MSLWSKCSNQRMHFPKDGTAFAKIDNFSLKLHKLITTSMALIWCRGQCNKIVLVIFVSIAVTLAYTQNRWLCLQHQVVHWGHGTTKGEPLCNRKPRCLLSGCNGSRGIQTVLLRLIANVMTSKFWTRILKQIQIVMCQRVGLILLVTVLHSKSNTWDGSLETSQCQQ
jgi:hypothetical protein